MTAAASSTVERYGSAPGLPPSECSFSLRGVPSVAGGVDDHGRVSRVVGVSAIKECLGSGDGVGAGRTVLEFSTKQTCVGKEEQEAFLRDMDAVFKERCKGYYTVR